MIRIDDHQRRARLAQRHHLAAGAEAADPTQVARSLVALHSTDPASVILGCMARLASPDPASVERALYEDRSLVRLLGMRRTVFVAPVETMGVIHAGCTRAIAVQERAKLVRVVEEAGIAADGAIWLEEVERETMRALLERGEALGQELSQAVPVLRTQVSYGDETKKWGGKAALTTRILFVMAAEGRIIRGRPRGSWTSSQHRWVPREVWLAGRVGPDPPVQGAQVELARQWLAAYGPGTAADLKWWAGWTMGETRRALAKLSPVEVELDGRAGPGLVLPGDEAPLPESQTPWAALLPALDSTVMGWADREWFLDEALPRTALFDRSGNAGPTLWWDGHVVGGWAQRKNGEIATRLLRDVGADATAAIASAADRLRRLIGDVRVTPRFHTPLEQQLCD